MMKLRAASRTRTSQKPQTAGKIVALVTSGVITIAASLFGAAPANAVTGAMIVPTTGTVSGYVGGYCGVPDEDQPHAGIDLFNAEGTSVVAAASGTVTSVGSDPSYGNRIRIAHGAGYTTLYAHLKGGTFKVAVGQTVQQGQLLAEMGNTGDSTGPHLHFEVRKDEDPQDGINGFFPCGASRTVGTPIAWDFPDLGSSTVATERYAVLDTAGKLWVKEGNPYSNWVIQASNVTSYSLSGNRIGVVSGGTAYVKEGDLYAPWSQLSGGGGIKDLVLDGARVAMLGNDGILNVKEGALNAAWVQQTGGVKKVVMSGNRIGIIGTNAVVSVKEGDLYQPWVNQGVGDDLSLSGSRIGVIVGGVAQVKEGTLWAGWNTMTGGSGATDIELSGDRVGVLVSGGALIVKQGPLSAGWTNQLAGVSQFSLSGDKIGILAGGTTHVKEGTLWDGWVVQMPSTTRIIVAN